MKKVPQGLWIYNGCDTLNEFWLKKGFMAGLIMLINQFFIDQPFSGVDQSTEIFMSVEDDDLRNVHWQKYE